MMKEKLSRIIVAVTAIFIIVTTFAVGVAAGRESVAQGNTGGNVLGGFFVDNYDATPAEDVDLEQFWRVWNLINEKYVASDMPSNDEKVWGAINGLVQSLDDPYSVFLQPVESRVFEEDVSGSFEGVGMEVGMRDGFLTVIAPLKGTPADDAGLLSGDTITKIDDTSTFDLSLNEAVDLIRGPRGSEVILTIVREGERETLEISITRDKIDIPVIQTELREDGVFVIELYSFYETAPDLFSKAIREFKASGSEHLVLDLRNNPGGFLEAAVDIAGNFLPKGKLVAREDYGEGGKEIEHRAYGNYLLKNYKYDLIILINQGSASASEILAGALREHNIATIVGEKSFGKGSVQELLKFDDGTSLKITIARWLTPEGVSISENGLKPDIEAERTFEDFEAGEDPQLDTAVDELLGNE